MEIFIGFVFANLDPEALSMDGWFSDARGELEAFAPNWTGLNSLEWAEITEN